MSSIPKNFRKFSSTQLALFGTKGRLKQEVQARAAAEARAKELEETVTWLRAEYGIASHVVDELSDRVTHLEHSRNGLKGRLTQALRQNS